MPRHLRVLRLCLDAESLSFVVGGFEELGEETFARGELVDYDPVEREKRDAARAATKRKEAETARATSIRAKKWPAAIEQAVLKRQVQIGMEQARMAWGRPEKINRRVGSWGTHEQWVYGSTYLYFENGILRSFQDSR
jgi:hypothetical protein